MKKATLTGKQAKKILEIFEDAPAEQVQSLLASGLLADVRDANFHEEINRNEVRHLLGLKPLIPTIAIIMPTYICTVEPAFVHDKTKDGWTLISDVGFQPGEVELVEFLKPGENSVNGKVMAARAKELGANLGQKHAEWLEENQDRIPTEFRQFRLSFPGTVWQGPNGRCYVSYLCWSGDRWHTYFLWLECGWYYSDRLLRFRK